MTNTTVEATASSSGKKTAENRASDGFGSNSSGVAFCLLCQLVSILLKLKFYLRPDTRLAGVICEKETETHPKIPLYQVFANVKVYANCLLKQHYCFLFVAFASIACQSHNINHYNGARSRLTAPHISLDLRTPIWGFGQSSAFVNCITAVKRKTAEGQFLRKLKKTRSPPQR